eukprot:gb/GECH01001009.1/.p1 GENE.gb/GECH01001009.1/~~gb/GECH01001009.1/.p1  ORF type:complete len:158 (+),score=14.88 gb/GECH01001009.1/:1-474(+)
MRAKGVVLVFLSVVAIVIPLIFILQLYPKLNYEAYKKRFYSIIIPKNTHLRKMSNNIVSKDEETNVEIDGLVIRNYQCSVKDPEFYTSQNTVPDFPLYDLSSTNSSDEAIHQFIQFQHCAVKWINILYELSSSHFKNQSNKGLPSFSELFDIKLREF